MIKTFNAQRRRSRISRHSSDQAETSRRLSRCPCTVEHLVVTNDTGTDGWVMVFDSEDEPENGDTPILRFPIPGDGSVGLDVPIPIKKKGWLAVSTTRDVLTTSSDGAYFYANVSDG